MLLLALALMSVLIAADQQQIRPQCAKANQQYKSGHVTASCKEQEAADDSTSQAENTLPATASALAVAAAAIDSQSSEQRHLRSTQPQPPPDAACQPACPAPVQLLARPEEASTQMQLQPGMGAMPSEVSGTLQGIEQGGTPQGSQLPQSGSPTAGSCS